MSDMTALTVKQILPILAAKIGISEGSAVWIDRSLAETGWRTARKGSKPPAATRRWTFAMALASGLPHFTNAGRDLLACQAEVEIAVSQLEWACALADMSPGQSGPALAMDWKAGRAVLGDIDKYTRSQTGIVRLTVVNHEFVNWVAATVPGSGTQARSAA